MYVTCKFMSMNSVMCVHLYMCMCVCTYVCVSTLGYVSTSVGVSLSVLLFEKKEENIQ